MISNGSPVTAFLARRRYLRLTIAFVIVLSFAVGFTALADEVRDRDTLVYDTAVLTSVNSLSQPFLDGLFVNGTDIGGVIGVTCLALIAIAVMLNYNRYRSALFIVIGVGGAALINLVLKTLFERIRPSLWEQLVVEQSYSFPSGHSVASSALALTLIIVSWRTRYRWLVLTGALLYMFFVGFSRLYLGVHYPTDILAGWIVSAAWIATIVVTLDLWRIRSVKRKASRSKMDI